MSSITLEQEIFSFGIEDYCKERDEITNKSPLVWLSWKQRLDKLHLYHTRDHPKLWRIHDQVYDFSKFQHPGGQAFLDLTVNTDITELFESSHPNIGKVRGYLDKYLVETAKTLHPRYTKKFTFDEKGFYCTLRERIFQAIPQLPSISYFQSSAFVHDTFFVSFLVTVFLSVVPGIPTPVSYVSMVLSGILMACLGNASHNYFHLKDNWRMYTIDFTGFSSHEWRISHVYSHHTFSNTLLDVEIWGFEPIVSFLPWSNKKDPSTGFKVILGVFLLFPLIGLLSFFKRMFAILTGAEAKRWENFLPLYLFMLLVYFRGILIASKNSGIPLSSFIGESVEVVALRLLITYLTCSSVFINLGLAGAHHHPSVWHAGDNTIEQKDKPIDWGLFQLMAVAYRPEVDESLILSSITFGRHSMHHLFPTIDLMYYPYLMPILVETCKEFKVLDLCPLPREKSSVWSKRKTLTLWQGWLGMFKQAVRYETDITNFPPNI